MKIGLCFFIVEDRYDIIYRKGAYQLAVKG